MKQTKDMSIRLTRACILAFAAVLLIADLFAFRWIRLYVTWRKLIAGALPWLLAAFYAASVSGWFCLRALWKLLRNIRQGAVFCGENVKALRGIAICCASAALIFLVGGAVYPPLFIPAVAAGFMMLIVRVVENVFRQALEMKSELDLTI